MDGLLTLLLFAGFFYFMMRFGCGAHMVHGHSDADKNRKTKNHGDHGREDSDNTKHIDPVCGMEVDTAQGYGKMHQGQLYRFCHRSCLDKFESDPGKYLKKEIEVDGGEA